MTSGIMVNERLVERENNRNRRSRYLRVRVKGYVSLLFTLTIIASAYQLR